MPLRASRDPPLRRPPGAAPAGPHPRRERARVAAHAARLNMADPFVDHDRRELHRLLAAAFADAAALVGAATATFRVGREHIRVRTAGDALALPLTRAMRHIRVDPMMPATATIDAWDSASTGRPLPVLADHL